MTITGDPDRLEQYTSMTLPALAPARTDAVDCGSLLAALRNAPSSISFWVADYSGWIGNELSAIERVDRRPAAFGFALRQLDHFVVDMPRDRTWLGTSDVELFNALVDARLAHPTDPDADVYKLALDALTGTPQELAGQVESVLEQINGTMSTDDVEAMADELRQLLYSLHDGNVYRDPPLTEPEIVQQAWVILNARGDDDIVPAATVQELGRLTDLLGRRRFDPTYTTAFYQSLGPDNTALLPRAIALSSWSDFQRTSGHPEFAIDNTLANVDSALATASPNLSTAWRDGLFEHAVHDGTVDDAFPLLFQYGQFSTAFAQPSGQLGLDILHGTVTVDRGVGSPGYANFDNLATHWEDRGTMLIEAAARTPDAANALLRNADDAAWLTDNKFGRDGRHPPDWDVIDSSVRNLIVSGTVYEAQAHPASARDAAANVINAALHEQPGDASRALAPAYGQMVLQYLPDFALSPGFNRAAERNGDHLSIGTMQAAQFTSLAMDDDASKQAIFRLRDILDLQTVVVGLESETSLYPPWEQRLANIDGIVLTGDNGEVFVSARWRDAEAQQYNDNLDMFQGIAMGVIGLAKFPGSGIADKLIDKGVDQLKDDFLYRDTNHASEAGYTTNVAAFSAFDHERLVVAQAHLIAAVRVEQSGGALTVNQAAFIEHATATVGQPYVDALRAAANGLPATPVDVRPRDLQDWAGTTALDDFTEVSNYTDLILPQDGTSLWPH